MQIIININDDMIDAAAAGSRYPIKVKNDAGAIIDNPMSKSDHIKKSFKEAAEAAVANGILQLQAAQKRADDLAAAKVTAAAAVS